MDSFFERLEKRVREADSLLCVGLDPHASDLPKASAAAARDYCLRLVKATAPYAAAFKPNAAFFEAFAADGWKALKEVIDGIREEAAGLGAAHLPIILDAKRGDIASTAEAYARSAFETLGADCITLSPYLGRDSIEPFIQEATKGAFLLCRTSNLGSADVQELIVQSVKGSAVPLYVRVAQLAAEWNTRGNLGLVVGATFPETLAQVRANAEGLWFLVPGVGAQGGDLGAALRNGLRPDGMGVLVNVARTIARASDPQKAAADLRDEMIKVRKQLKVK